MKGPKQHQGKQRTYLELGKNGGTEREVLPAHGPSTYAQKTARKDGEATMALNNAAKELLG